MDRNRKNDADNGRAARDITDSGFDLKISPEGFYIIPPERSTHSIRQRNKKNGIEAKDAKTGESQYEPTVAPGFDDEKFGEDATAEDIKKGNYTKVTRAFLDENDPS